MRRFSIQLWLAALIIAPALGGCGVFSARNPDFRNAETGEDGQIYVLDDLEAIANDTTLTDDEKLPGLPRPGIEDEHPIDALLTLLLAAPQG
ncbi:MAG: hypothetical protein H6816_12945 [Phycisphaerales bacterium]|nr:hypothetical protein [Phycisphaerales bacterium]